MTKRMAFRAAQIQARERIRQRRRMRRYRARLLAFAGWTALWLLFTLIIAVIGRLA